MGRPSKFTKALADAISERLMEGESLRSITSNEDMPSQSMVYRWLTQHEGFREQYAQARETQADTIADEILDIADDGRNDWLERQNADGSTYEVVNAEAVARSRIRIDARKWYAGKLRPKKYGEKLELEHGGEVRVSKVTVEVVDPQAR